MCVKTGDKQTKTTFYVLFINEAEKKVFETTGHIYLYRAGNKMLGPACHLNTRYQFLPVISKFLRSNSRILFNTKMVNYNIIYIYIYIY